MGEVRYGDFKSKRQLSRAEVIEQTANIAAAIGMRDGRASEKTLAALKQGLAERWQGLTEDERKQVDRLARQKIDAQMQNLGGLSLTSVIDSRGREVGIISSEPVTPEERALLDTWADVICGDIDKIGNLAAGLSQIDSDRSERLREAAQFLAQQRSEENL